MAASFWHSSHCQDWLKNEDALTMEEKAVREEKKRRDDTILTDEEQKMLRVHLAVFLSSLGRYRNVRCRQRIISTAVVYVARFFYNNSYKDFHPHLIAATALLLAAKVEECHFPGLAKNIADALRDLNPSLPYHIHDIIDGEYFLMEELKFQLVVFHPYRAMQHFIHDIKMEKLGADGGSGGKRLASEVGMGGEPDSKRLAGPGGAAIGAGGRDSDADAAAKRLAGVTETAWCLLNDSYRLDVCLFYPPHILAVAAVNLACAYINVDASGWFENLNFLPAHREQVKQVEEELLILYEEYSHLKPDEISRVLSKVPIHAAVLPPQQVTSPPPTETRQT